MTPRCGALMICGTTSDAGKSTLVAGLCRLLARQGVAVAPFKGQNMSLNSMVTAEGAEIGRAQWLQARAALVPAEAAMNPVLLKPTSEHSSQVVLMGRPLGVQEAAPYQRSKDRLIDVVDGALASLRDRFDVVICEGAGSPAEINLLDNDIVNLGLARRAGIPAVVVGDIHRGGVFAHLYGTVAILPEDLRACVKGFIINMFRGDQALLGDATEQLEQRCGVPTLGVVPYLPELVLDAEDSLHHLLRTLEGAASFDGEGIDVAVIRFPRLSNFTDLDPLLIEPGVRVRFVGHPSALGQPDLVVLPGTKSTVADLEWMRAGGLADALEALRRRPRPPAILGICGGFQILGRRICDPGGVESTQPEVDGLGWLDLTVTFATDKVTRLRQARDEVGNPVEGYEIHHGLAAPGPSWQRWLDPVGGEFGDDVASGRAPGLPIFGTAVHGAFEADGFRHAFLALVAQEAGKIWRPSGRSFEAARQSQIDRVADACADALDFDTLWRIIESSAIPA
ncbi:MAG TPA: cobyric acid synthase [Acidimicrobiales bacterium]